MCSSVSRGVGHFVARPLRLASRLLDPQQPGISRIMHSIDHLAQIGLFRLPVRACSDMVASVAVAPSAATGKGESTADQQSKLGDEQQDQKQVKAASEKNGASAEDKAKIKEKKKAQHESSGKAAVQKAPDADIAKALDLMAPYASCDSSIFSFEKLVKTGGVDKEAFPDLVIDFSNAHLPNPEQDTPPESDKLLMDNLRDCLKTFADFGYLNGKCNHRHPINLYVHPPVYTCDQAERFVQPSVVKSAHMKNLFVKDKKKNLFLISALVDTEIKLGKLKLKGMANGGASFASNDVLLEALGLIPGSVTPFGLINDSMAKIDRRDGDKLPFVPKVTYYLDKNALDYEYLAFHPNACNATVDIHRATFVDFIERVTGHEVNILVETSP